MDTIILNRKSGDFGFEACDNDNHIVTMDTKPELDGTSFGARPMQLLLMGLGGCSGIDVVSILKKQKQDVHDVQIIIEAERQQNGDVSLWKTVHVKFILVGNIDKEKAQKACDLSMKKYCSVAATLRLANCDISYTVETKS